MKFRLKSFVYHWVIVACLVFIIVVNISMHIDIKRSSQFLGNKIDILGNSMVVLNSEVDDSLLPQIFPDELWTEFDLPEQREIEHKTFTASLASQIERKIIASISKISNNMLEIGTGKGGTTLIMAAYSPPGANVSTIDLPDNVRAILYEQGDSPTLAANAVNSRVSSDYVYKKTKHEKKIHQIFADTKHFDETNLSKQLDFIFVDGANTYSYIKNDTKKALNMIKVNGFILWHNYDKKFPDVIRFINELSQTHKVYKIKDTTLVIYKAH